MTIVACLFHGEVVFPRPDEIINGRYVKRRIRRPRTIDMTNADASAYHMRPLRITHVSRPCLFNQFDPWTDWGSLDRMRSHVRDMILDQPENKVRAKLRELESERRQCYSECVAISREIAMFQRLVDQGFYCDWVGSALRARREYLENAKSRAYGMFDFISAELNFFKADVLPTIYPINNRRR